MKREIFLEHLPRCKKGDHAKIGNINWRKSIGYKVNFIYGDIEGEVEIVGYSVKENLLYIKYEDKEILKIRTNHFQQCKLGGILICKTTIWDTDRWMVDLGVSEEDAKRYSRGSSVRIGVTCPNCGNKRSVSINQISTSKSIGCYCGDGKSYPEKFMFSVLKQTNIEFTPEYSQDWSKPKRYDFYFELNNEKYIVETHGLQHYKQRGDAKRNTKQEQENDEIKKKSALKNGIKEENYIVINCSKSDMEFIKNKILKSRLNQLFDLSNIDWDKCEEFSLSNRVLEACEIKRNNTKMPVAEIARIMKLNPSTIFRYFKKAKRFRF